MRIALLVAYDGTGFHGFARQPRARTVQGTLEDRLSVLFRVPITTVGAGRTDTGVHASGQVVSFDVPRAVDPLWLQRRLNRWIAPEISVRAAAVVSESFSARFSAVRRSYEYRIYRTDPPDPFEDRFSLHVPEKLSLVSMRAAARALLGEHDFASFCRRGQTGTVRHLRAIRIRPDGDRLVIAVDADSFCHQMVRSIVGLLLEVGRQRRRPEEVAGILAARDRSMAGPVAPARGLHLLAVRYGRNPFGAATR